MTFEDMDDEQSEVMEETPAPEGASNRTFFIVAGVLGGILLLALICLALYSLIYAPQQRNQQATQVAEIDAQNTQLAMAVTQTSEAARWTATPSNTPTAAKTIAYVVREGDTLESIARMFAVTVEELLALNQKPNVTIQLGEQILIPDRGQIQTRPTVYVAREGDTLESIARIFGMTMAELLALNQKLNVTIQPGEEIQIPDQGQIQTTPTVYVVQEGDTLESIARKFGVTEAELLALNQMPDATIQPSEEIQIPDQGQIQTTPTVYVAQEGDTLESIARKFGVTVAELLALNQKLNVTIQPGEEIQILDRGQIQTTPTPVLAAPTIGASPTADRTATVAFLLTEAAAGKLTITPTASGLPDTGFADDVGVPGLVGLALVLIVVVFLARRLRTAS